MTHTQAERFETLAAEHERAIYLLCLRMTGNRQDAQDCAQEALLRAFRAYSRFRGEARFKTWLYRIAHNACVDSLRARRADVSLEHLREAGFDAPDTRAPTPYLAMEEAQRRQALLRAIGQLPVDQRAVLTLRDIQGLSYEEIADVLDTPEGTVKSRLNRARERLRALLTPDRELFTGDIVQTGEGRQA